MTPLLNLIRKGHGVGVLFLTEGWNLVGVGKQFTVEERINAGGGFWVKIGE